MTIVLLSTCAILTSIISGMIGMGGGILLLSIMTFFLPLNIIVPIHGVAQLTSNSSRVFYLRHHINRKFLIFFALGTPIGFLASFYLLKGLIIDQSYYLILATFIIYIVFKPKRMPQIKLKSWGWSILGVVAVIQGAFIGATGPLIAPFYIRDDLDKEEIIATKASQQILIHFLKLPLFLSLSFAYGDYFWIILGLCVCSILGSYLGTKKILQKIEDHLFKIIFKVVLMISALRLIYKYFN